MQTTQPAPRLADLVELARTNRSSPEGLRQSVARRMQFLRNATSRVAESVFARRDRVREEVTAMAHALRVRAGLTAAEQQAFDLLVVDYTETVLGLLIDRSTEESIEAVRRHLASVALTMP